MTEPDRARLPERLGEYRILSLLGEGGMGAVYEAEQQNPRRHVALKVIRAGLASSEVLRRFEHEAAVLARLQHPGIAQIHEAGTFEVPGGAPQPFFAMELVRGAPLTRHSEERALDTRARLELVVRVCQAVEHAHQRGIVHRDLKPANILVDATGQPKILDFGVARLTDSDVQATTMHTDVGQIIGTLPYMSPEQASGRPEELDTRSDVYALGVIAYELLAGRLPHDLQKLVLHEAVRVIREDEPSRLSSIDRDLRGDVETIVGKALEKDKTRRYASAGELATDIQRYLRDEAISARPASSWYQFAKFARRNRVLVGGVLATVFALAGGLVVSAVQYVKAADARDLAETRRQEAARAAEESSSINGFLIEMLGAADLKKMGRDAKVSQALAAAGAEVGTAFPGKPHVERAVERILSRTYVSLGMYDEAELHVKRWIELAQELEGAQRSQHAEALQSHALCLRARARYAECEPLQREAVEIATAAEGPESPLTLGVRADLANTLRALRRLDESEAIYREVLAIRRRGDPRAPGLQVAINSLGVLLQAKRRHADAEPLYREASALGEELWGPDNPDTLVSRCNLASALVELDRRDEAEPMLVDLVPRMRRVFGDLHAQTAIALNQYGRFLAKTGKAREAVPVLEESLASHVRVQGERTLEVALTKHELAMAKAQLGDSKSAAVLLREVLDVESEQLQADEREVIATRSDLALALSRSGHEDEAEPIYRALVEQTTRVFGPDDKSTLIALNSLAVLCMGQARNAEAVPLLERALESLARAYPPDDRDAAITAFNLFNVRYALGQTDAAVAAAPDVLARLERVFGPKHPTLASGQSTVSVMLREIGRFEEAEDLCRRALSIRRAAFGDAGSPVLGSTVTLGEVRLARGAAQEGLDAAEHVLAVLLKQPSPEVGLVASARSLRGRSLAQLGRFAEAELDLVEAQRTVEASRAAAPRAKRTAIERLAAFYAQWNAAEPADERAARASEWKSRLDALPAAK